MTSQSVTLFALHLITCSPPLNDLRGRARVEQPPGWGLKKFGKNEEYYEDNPIVVV